MAHLKLMKMLYLADRESIRRSGFPITGDHFVSMQHGPVLSMTLNHMDGDVESRPGGWDEWISDKENNEISLRKAFVNDELDELSEANIEVLSSIWDTFGAMGKWEIRDWTHNNCAEWVDPHGSSNPITYKNVAIALGFSSEAASNLDSRIRDEIEIDGIFAAL